MSQRVGSAPRTELIFPREFKRSGSEQIDWKLMGFGASVFAVAVILIVIFANVEPPQLSAEDAQRRAARVVSQLKMPDIPPEPVPVEEKKDEEEVAVVEEAPMATEQQPRERVRASGGGGGGGGGGDRSAGRARRGDARAAAAAALAQQGVWAQLSTGSSGSGASVAAGFGAGDLESNIGKVGGVKRGGTSSFTGEGDGTGSGEGAVVGPGGTRSGRGGGSGGIGIEGGSLVGGSGSGIGGGGAGSVGSGGGGPGGGVDIDVNAIADAGGGGSSRDDSRTGAALQSVIRQNLGPIKFCYERELKLNPKLEGALRLKLTIAANGRVTNAEIAGDTIGNENLSRCVQGRVRAWKFEPASGESIVTVTLPFSPNG